MIRLILFILISPIALAIAGLCLLTGSVTEINEDYGYETGKRCDERIDCSFGR